MTLTDGALDELVHEAAARRDRHAETLGGNAAWRFRGPDDPFSAAQEWGHHWRWTDASFYATRARIEGLLRRPRLEDDAQNAAWAAEDASLTYDEARAKYDAVLAGYVAYLQGLSPEQRDEAVAEWFAGAVVEHFDQHYGFIVEGALLHEEAAWQRLTGLLDARASGVLHTGDDGQPWSAADIYAHIERWMTANIPRVDAFLASGTVPELPASVDELNARWSKEDAGVAFDAARTRTVEARTRFMAQMRTIPLDRWTARLMGLYGGNAWGHYAEHLEYLDAEGGA